MKLNGNLVLNTDATGELQNVYIERLASSPAFVSGHKGRVYFNTTNATYYFNDGTTWSPFATGGNAAALQTEVDNIEAAIGASVNADGTYNAAGFAGNSLISGATSVTAAIQALATKALATDTLAELGDVALASLATGQVLMYGGTTWNNHTMVIGDISGITASAAEINKLTGATLSTTELNFVTGVTSSIQTQLNNKQPLDATLTALAGLSSTGIVVETGVDTFAQRTLVAPAAGITITDPAGIAGNPTFALANDLAAYEGLTGSGYVVRTGDGTATVRSIAGTTGNVVVTNGSGVSSDTSIDLAAVSQAATGDFRKITLDGFGRVTGNVVVTTADITALVDATYVNATGDSMTGSLVMAAGTHITLTDAAVNSTDAVNKAYVDAIAQGLSWKNAVKAASTGDLTLSGLQTVDGISLLAGDRVLVKNQTAAAQNGIYVVSAGSWTRALDMDIAAEFEGTTVLVQEGTTQADYGFTQTYAVTTVGTSPVNFVQFTGSSVLTAGVGLTQIGNVLSVNMGAGVVELDTGNVGIDLYNATGGNGALILTTDGATHNTGNASKLHLLLDTGSGLTQTITGLKIDALGVTNAMLLHPSVTINSDTGTGTLALGGTLEIKGTSTQGISTSNSGTVVTVTAADASYSQKGVAVFSSNDFTVTAGSVVIAAAGVDNAQLANSTITMAGNAGTPQAVALGSTFTLGDGGTHATAGNLVIATAGTSTNRTDISIRLATSSLAGVASFAAGDFTVTAGAVAIIAKPLDSLTDVTIGTPAAGDTLIYSGAGTQFVNRPTYYLYTSGAASTSHTVNHSLGQKFCNVTVVDATDEVVIPQSITFMSAGQLIVTFTSAIACKVVVMGVNQG